MPLQTNVANSTCWDTVLGGVLPAGQGRWSIPSTQHRGSHVWGNVSSLGLPSARKTWTHCRESQRWLRTVAPMWKGWCNWDCSTWRRLRRDLISAYKYLTGKCKTDRTRTFSVVISDRTRGNVHKMKYMRFPLDIRKYIFFPERVMEHWHQIVQRCYGVSILEILKKHLDRFLSNQF